MIKWTQKDFLDNQVWYHATTMNSAKNIIEKGVLAKINQGKPLDFGYGFYLTPNKDWAISYLINQLLITEGDGSVDKEDGCVLEFNINLNEIITNSIKLVFIEDMDKDFATVVYRNRQYPFLSKLLYRYDVMGGPMSDGKQLDDFTDYNLGRITKGELFERLLNPKEDWQLVIRNQNLCDILKVAKIYDKEGNKYEIA